MPNKNFARLFYVFTSDFDSAHKNFWGGCKALEGVSEYEPILSTFVDYCG